MKAMIPFYYAVAALLFGVLGGFCARCHQINGSKNFIRVLKLSAWAVLKNSLIAFLLPILVVVSDKFRKLLVLVLIDEAAENYAVSISDTDKNNLIDVLLEEKSTYNITKIAISLAAFYFANLDGIANSTMRNISETLPTAYKTESHYLSRAFFGKTLSFYKTNVFARATFCL